MQGRKIISNGKIYLPDIKPQKLICQPLQFTWDIVLALAKKRNQQNRQTFLSKTSANFKGNKMGKAPVLLLCCFLSETTFIRNL